MKGVLFFLSGEQNLACVLAYSYLPISYTMVCSRKVMEFVMVTNWPEIAVYD